MTVQTNTVGVVAVLTIEGKEFDLVTFSFGFFQDVDERGYPCAGTRAHLIEMVVAAREDQEADILFDWAFRADRQLNGRVEFAPNTERDTILRSIEFEDAYCVGFAETAQGPGSPARAYVPLHIPKHRLYDPAVRGRETLYETGFTYRLVVTPEKVKVGTISFPT
ncbi:type VI secretion system tube protein TssD [Larkinella soli]|uniref:type VI secretion system tube protein TssD n=1 Tax=Larkinella soli TaxID=1770527 RepID=UPI000FFC5493|nr:type VI secretion system tube protein TssD [Larkinella soli]